MELYCTWQIDCMGLGKKVGLWISDSKTKTMMVEKHHVMPPVTLDNQNIENVRKFQYLGNYMAEDGDVEVNIRTRIAFPMSTTNLEVQHNQQVDQIMTILFYHCTNSDLCLGNVEDNSESYQDDWCVSSSLPHDWGSWVFHGLITLPTMA